MLDGVVGGMPSVDGGVGIGDEVLVTDGDMPPIGLGDG